MPISIITNFEINDNSPIDSRIIASSSSDRENIAYVYDGLKVFQLDNREVYTWNTGSATWSMDSSALISGSGVTNSVPYWKGTLGITSSNIYFNNNKVGINTSNPLGDLQINTSYNGGSLPLVITKDTVTTIGSNWYFSATDQVFDTTEGSAKIVFDDNILYFYNRQANTIGTAFAQSMMISNNKVGINVFGGSDLKGNLQINPSNSTSTSTPFVIHSSDSSSLNTIGHNWYYAGGSNQAFVGAEGSVKIDFEDSSAVMYYRLPGSTTTTYNVGCSFSAGNMLVTGDMSLLGYPSLKTKLDSFSASIASINTSITSINTSISTLNNLKSFAVTSFLTSGGSGLSSYTIYPTLSILDSSGGFVLGNSNRFIQLPAGKWMVDITARILGTLTNAVVRLYSDSFTTAYQYPGGPVAKINNCTGNEDVRLTLYFNASSAFLIGCVVTINDTASTGFVLANGTLVVRRIG